MKKTFTKGFTLIELLVVIAIIGILASVILASLNTARSKGADAAVKSDLTNARAQAELYYDNRSPNTYVGVCTGTSADAITTMIADAASKSGTTVGVNNGSPASQYSTVCHDSLGAWAAEAPLKATAGNYFCVDSTGVAKTTTNALLSNIMVCS